jgi:hypothetical protein
MIDDILGAPVVSQKESSEEGDEKEESNKDE